LINDYIYGKKEIPITLDSIYAEINRYNTVWEEFFNHFETLETSITSSNTTRTNEYLEFNPDEKKTNAILLKSISKDVYIEESCNILIDYINTNKAN